LSVPTQTHQGEDSPSPERAAFERIPPQDLTAEQCVLGAMLLSKDAIADISEILRGRDFYKPAHETIYRTILDLYAAGEPADPITVASELTKRGELAKVGGAGYVQSLPNVVPTAANGEYYAEIVYDRAIGRRLAAAGVRITEIGYAQQGDPTEQIDAAEKELFDVAGATSNADTLQPFIFGYDQTMDEIQAAASSGDITGVPTGFTDLDHLTHGLQPGQMIVIAGRPGQGKTTLALDIARTASIKHHRPVAFFSLEMGRGELHRKVTAAEASVALHHLNTGRVDEAGWERVARHHAKFADAPLFIDDAPDLTMMSIRTKARRLAQRSGLDLLVVDYLQLLQHGGRGGRRLESRQQEVSEISRSLKLLAKELQVPVIALSQLNRGPEQRSDKKPMVADLRDSGSIEQDSDIVMLLHREDAYEKASPRSGEADIDVAKHRGGPTSIISVAFQGHYSRFVNMEGGS
jgi:replicative DNA helicase